MANSKVWDVNLQPTRKCPDIEKCDWGAFYRHDAHPCAWCSRRIKIHDYFRKKEK